MIYISHMVERWFLLLDIHFLSNIKHRLVILIFIRERVVLYSTFRIWGSFCLVYNVANGSIRGADAHKFVERVTVADVEALKTGTGVYALITNAKGGIIDDTIVTNYGTHLGMVVNGACKEKDLKHLREILVTEFGGLDVSLDVLPNALVAVQGRYMVVCLL